MPKPSRRRWTLLLTVMTTVLVSVPAAVWASHQFTDVPDDHTHHTGISWMKDNNITVGCNPPTNTEYCPGDNVTRGQMATFMKRLAENNVVDAATLDGLDSEEISVLLLADGDANGGGTALTNSGRVDVNSIPIDVPLDGFLVVSGQAFINNQSGAPRQYALNVLLDGVDALPQDWTSVTSFEAAPEQDRGNLTYTITIPISAGAHTLVQEVGPYSGVASFFYNQETLTAVYYPNTVGSLVLSSVDTSGGDPQGN